MVLQYSAFLEHERQRAEDARNPDAYEPWHGESSGWGRWGELAATALVGFCLSVAISDLGFVSSALHDLDAAAGLREPRPAVVVEEPIGFTGDIHTYKYRSGLVHIDAYGQPQPDVIQWTRPEVLTFGNSGVGITRSTDGTMVIIGSDGTVYRRLVVDSQDWTVR